MCARPLQLPTHIGLNDVLTNRVSFSPSNYRKVVVKRKHAKQLRELLSETPVNGEEVGSDAYVSESNRYFIRTSALQSTSLLINCGNGGVVPILPKVFVDHSLNAGDLLISKDSNIGEVVVLDRDLPHHMISSGLYKLSIDARSKYYTLALIKHEFFKSQLNTLIARGSTIKHAKTLFLDCLIPFPITNSEEYITQISNNTRLIMDLELRIRSNESRIHELIDGFLGIPRKLNNFQYRLPSIGSVTASGRIDAGFYSKELLSMQWLIGSCKEGAGSLNEWGYEISRGQNLQVSAIGQSIYSEEPVANFYRLARPMSFSNYGTVERYEYLGNDRQLSVITPGDIVFSAEGSIGKCVMFAECEYKTITNIHGIILNKTNYDPAESAYICSFLRYLRVRGVLDKISTGGQGGSLAKRYFEIIKIPYLNAEGVAEVSKLYYNPASSQAQDKGIMQLDEELKALQQENIQLIERILEQHLN